MKYAHSIALGILLVFSAAHAGEYECGRILPKPKKHHDLCSGDDGKTTYEPFLPDFGGGEKPPLSEEPPKVVTKLCECILDEDLVLNGKTYEKGTPCPAENVECSAGDDDEEEKGDCKIDKFSPKEIPYESMACDDNYKNGGENPSFCPDKKKKSPHWVDAYHLCDGLPKKDCTAGKTTNQAKIYVGTECKPCSKLRPVGNKGKNGMDCVWDNICEQLSEPKLIDQKVSYDCKWVSKPKKPRQDGYEAPKNCGPVPNADAPGGFICAGSCNAILIHAPDCKKQDLIKSTCEKSILGGGRNGPGVPPVNSTVGSPVVIDAPVKHPTAVKTPPAVKTPLPGKLGIR